MGLFGFFKKKKEEKPVKKGLYVINQEECIGCGECVNVCPLDAIVLIEGEYRISKKICAACGVCADECPVECITQED